MATFCGITLGASLVLITVNPWLATLLFVVSATGIIKANARH